MRLFLAVDISHGLRDRLARLQSRLSAEGVISVRWVRASAIHLTLRFLGEVSHERLEGLRAQLSPGAPFNPFRTAPDRLGVFPARGRPRVLFVSLEEPVPLAALAAWVEKQVGSAGFPPENRPFTPHLTLGRFREGARSFVGGLPEAGDALAGEVIDVERIVLFRSHLGPGGARYESLAEFPLLGGNAP